MEQTTDFMWIPSSNGLDLFKYKGKICHTVYSDDNYQIFYSENVNAVLNRKTEQVHAMSIDGWTRMVLKLESLLKEPTCQNSIFTSTKR